VQLEFAFLSGEICTALRPEKSGSAGAGNSVGDRTEVSRRHSTVEASTGRPEPERCAATSASVTGATTLTGEAQAADAEGKHGCAQPDLLEQILSRENMLAAWARVKANKGAPGIDKMSVEAFPEFARQHWERIRSALYDGSYRPAAVRRVMIPKATRGERPLGIPTVLDRVIQQAIAQVIGPRFEATFHPHSYGFRPGRRAHDALEQMKVAYQDKRRQVVDCDLKSFFDMVNHDLLMNRLNRKITDTRVLRLIGRYLRAGVRLADGTTAATQQGVPQGGPLSPLLANIMLDDLDWELDRRGLHFARYADDFLIFVNSRISARRVLASVTRFVETKLGLVVNTMKSKATSLAKSEFLGFRIHGGKLRWTTKVEKRFKERIRQLTSRTRGCSMAQRIRDLNRYITGWMNYFGYSHTFRIVERLDRWIRRRIRQCYWKDWKRSRPRRRRLLALGANPDTVHMATRSRKGTWRMAANKIVQTAMSNQWLWDQGVPNMRQQWIRLHYGSAG
jgi:RNA-directed DNA polymerase